MESDNTNLTSNSPMEKKPEFIPGNVNAYGKSNASPKPV